MAGEEKFINFHTMQPVRNVNGAQNATTSLRRLVSKKIKIAKKITRDKTAKEFGGALIAEQKESDSVFVCTCGC